MRLRTLQKNLWDRFPLMSSLVIAASIFMYVGCHFDPNRDSANSFFSFTWIMSVYEPAKWSVSSIVKLSTITFIFICILVNYTGFYKVAVAGMVGSFIWGVFVGFVLGSIKNKVLQISIPTIVLGVF